jgi:glutamyl-tRNA synthetase
VPLDSPVRASTHRGRFAPSPTGQLHLGNAWAALLGWLWARSERGAFLLRIEDLDAARVRPEYVEAMRADLDWLGLDFDGSTVFQSGRRELYDAALEQLRGQGRVYPCFCSRTEIARAVNAPHGPADEGPRYPGTCLKLDEQRRSQRGGTRPPAWRFRPTPDPTVVEDVLHGRILQDVASAVGDFVVRRNDGVASYQLAVLVDDAEMGITHVLRGDDLLGSTPRQVQLAQALGLTGPRYAHVPLLLDPDGKRLAKRNGPPGLTDLRKSGMPSDRVLGLLARWAQLSDGRPVSAAELVPRFSLDRLPRAPIVVDAGEARAALGS